MFYTYNFKNDKWLQLIATKENRYLASCTVFEGKIVVSASKSDNVVYRTLNSVEAYDYYENKWTYLPDMIEERYGHASVSMGNKLFVIGGYKNTSCEVFDSFSRKFSSFNTALIRTIIPFNNEAVCVGNKVIVFCMQWNYSETKVFIYDVVNETWSEKKIEVVNNLAGLSYVKYNSE